MNLMQIESGLLGCINARNKEMISPSYEVVFFSPEEIVIEIVVVELLALCSLYNDETHRIVVDRCVSKFFPFNICLVMADVNTTDIVSLRIRGLSINCLPSETIRTDKEIVEKPYVCDGNKYDTNPNADSETAENTTFSLGFSALL